MYRVDESGGWIEFREGLPSSQTVDPRPYQNDGKVLFESARTLPRLFLFGEGAGLWMRSMGDLVTGLAPLAEHDGLRLWQPAPNPFSERVLLRWEGPAGQATTVTVVDALGRRVRAFRATPPGAVTWDGRDDGGRVLPAGRYWVEISDAKGRARRNFVRVR